MRAHQSIAGDEDVVDLTFKFPIPVETAEARAAAEGRVAEYRRLRGALATTLDGQVALARWCRKEQMRQVEELHWAAVLRFAPNHGEARRRLGVREFRGRLLTTEQIAEYKRQVDEFEAANAKWQPVAERLKSAILRKGQDEQRDEALRELRAIRDPAAIPAMEQLLSSASDQLALEVVSVLRQIPGQQVYREWPRVAGIQLGRGRLQLLLHRREPHSGS